MGEREESKRQGLLRRQRMKEAEENELERLRAENDKYERELIAKREERERQRKLREKEEALKKEEENDEFEADLERRRQERRRKLKEYEMMDQLEKEEAELKEKLAK